MTVAYQEVAKTAMSLNPEERLALTTALDLSLEDEVRSQALRAAVRHGIDAINNGEVVALESPADVEKLLTACLEEANQQVRSSAV